jgi:hypothetical protein
MNLNVSRSSYGFIVHEGLGYRAGSIISSRKDTSAKRKFNRHLRYPRRAAQSVAFGHCMKFDGTTSLEATLKIFTLLAFVSMCQFANAETVQVKYLGAVSLDSFACTDVKEASDVSRICYDKAERYMLIRLQTTYYHYCAIDPDTVRGLQAAPSKRQFFETRIKGNGVDGPFDCRTHPIPSKYRK